MGRETIEGGKQAIPLPTNGVSCSGHRLRVLCNPDCGCLVSHPLLCQLLLAVSGCGEQL
jgi:hypothetical protein